jgi:myo-inositol 2-dehydrogenase/D-chiro-inositol 1-dehydrogenase
MAAQPRCSARPLRGTAARQTADNSLTAVLGRAADSTGRRVTFDFVAKESKLDLLPAQLAWDATLPPPSHAAPGRTKLA